MKYTIYDTITGSITDHGFNEAASLERIASKVPAGRGILLGHDGDPDREKVSTTKGDPALIQLSAEEKQLREAAKVRPRMVSKQDGILGVLNYLASTGVDLGPEWERIKPRA